MKKSVNLNGYATPEARSRRDARAFNASAIIATMRALGMTDEEIKAALLKMKSEQQKEKDLSTKGE